jgi:hypothetical protein
MAIILRTNGNDGQSEAMYLTVWDITFKAGLVLVTERKVQTMTGAMAPMRKTVLKWQWKIFILWNGIKIMMHLPKRIFKTIVKVNPPVGDFGMKLST